MAKELVYNIKINAKNGEKSIKELRNEIIKFDNTLGKLYQEQDKINNRMKQYGEQHIVYQKHKKELDKLNDVIKQTTKEYDELGNILEEKLANPNTIQDLTDAQALYNEELKQVEIGSEEFTELKGKIEEITETLKGDATPEMKEFNTNTIKTSSEIRGLGRSLTTLGSGLAYLTAGNKSAEELMNTFRKVEGITRTLTGGMDLLTRSYKLVSTAQENLKNVTVSSTVAQRALNVAMKANPAMLLVGAVTALAGAFLLLSRNTKESNVQMQLANMNMYSMGSTLNNIISDYDKVNEQLTEFRKNQDLAIEQAKAQGKNEQEILNLRRQQAKELEDYINVSLKGNERLIGLEENRTNILQSIDSQAELVRKLEEDYKKLNSEADKDLMGDQIKRERNVLDGLIKQRDIYNKRIEELPNLLNDVNRELSLQATVIRTELRNEYNNLLKSIEAIVKTNKETIEDMTTDDEGRLELKREREVQAVLDLLEEGRKLYKENSEEIIKLEEQTSIALMNINIKYNVEKNNLYKKDENNKEKSNKNQEKEEQRLTEALLRTREILARGYRNDLQNRLVDINNYYDELIELEGLTDGEIRDINELRYKELFDSQMQYLREMTNLVNTTASSVGDIFTAAFRDSFDEINNSFEHLNDLILGEDGILQRIQDGSLTMVDGITGAMQMAVEIMSAISEAARVRELEHIRNTYDEESNALSDSLARREISREEYDNQMRMLDQRKEMAERKAARDAFQRNKKLQLVNATIATAQAVLNAFQSGMAVPIIGPATAAIYAGIAATLGAAQIGVIASQSFKAARGGIVPGNGNGSVDSVPALLAPGEMVINSRSSAMFPDLISDINQAGGGKPLTPMNRLGSNRRENNPLSQNIIVHAVVSEQEVTETQENVDNARRRSRFL